MWFPLVAIVGMFLLIARFYQRFAARRTFFWWYLLPIIGYGGYAVRYASTEQLSGDFWGDRFGVFGAVTFVALSSRLFWQMMRKAKPK
jgi:RsiW-degrading membrane proteinase PrsW (M82 family)